MNADTVLKMLQDDWIAQSSFFWSSVEMAQRTPKTPVSDWPDIVMGTQKDVTDQVGELFRNGQVRSGKLCGAGNFWVTVQMPDGTWRSPVTDESDNTPDGIDLNRQTTDAP